jgi:ubiquinone/menaquinone biosynthesis C-methylase UbiE
MSYQDPDIADDYTSFSDSDNGQIQQQIIAEALQSYLPSTGNVLDVACGNGWLAAALAGKYQVRACDFSQQLIKEATMRYPDVAFDVADVTGVLPYENNLFDVSIFNMAAHDVSDLQHSFEEIARVTKPDGKILVTVANPYYSFPVGVWKRGWRKFIPGEKPWPKLRSYFDFKNKSSREFVWNEKFQSYFYTLPEYLEAGRTAGLELEKMEDLESKQDSRNFDMRYQLHRFPIILLLAFKKSSE